uniref:Uncharacterized protein n=1 Tax=viral metagenome TaxID=1070528 RepID=A0A6H1ZRE4_9ZZZZ
MPNPPKPLTERLLDQRVADLTVRVFMLRASYNAAIQAAITEFLPAIGKLEAELAEAEALQKEIAEARFDLETACIYTTHGVISVSELQNLLRQS